MEALKQLLRSFVNITTPRFILIVNLIVAVIALITLALDFDCGGLRMKWIVEQSDLVEIDYLVFQQAAEYTYENT